MDLVRAVGSSLLTCSHTSVRNLLSLAGSELTFYGRLAHHLGQTQRHTWTEDYNSYFNSYLCCLLSSLCSSSDDETIVSIAAPTSSFGIAGNNIKKIRIIFRAFQGIGGSGIYSLVMIIFFEMVPSSKYPTYTSVVSAIFALSLLLGPLIGGAINNHTTWRWVFILKYAAPFCIFSSFGFHRKEIFAHAVSEVCQQVVSP